MYFNTNNFEIFSCQLASTCASHVGFQNFFCQEMCWQLTLTLIQIGMHEFGISLDMFDWTLAFLIQIYFISFGFILLARWKQVYKRAHLLALSLAKACSFATTCWYPPACFWQYTLGFYYVSWSFGKLRIGAFQLYQQCRHCQHISAHNFLDIQPIFNPFKVLESSESGLFNCINSVDMHSIECIIFCIECHNLAVFDGIVEKPSVSAFQNFFSDWKSAEY